MNKTTIELARLEHIKGYGYVGQRPYTQDSQSTLDALVAWSEGSGNKLKTIYHHALRNMAEPYPVVKYHYAPEDSILTQEQCAALFAERMDSGRPLGRFETADILVYQSAVVYRIPYVHDVYYLDIYWQ